MYRAAASRSRPVLTGMLGAAVLLAGCSGFTPPPPATVPAAASPVAAATPALPATPAQPPTLTPPAPASPAAVASPTGMPFALTPVTAASPAPSPTAVDAQGSPGPAASATVPTSPTLAAQTTVSPSPTAPFVLSPLASPSAASAPGVDQQALRAWVSLWRDDVVRYGTLVTGPFTEALRAGDGARIAQEVPNLYVASVGLSDALRAAGPPPPGTEAEAQALVEAVVAEQGSLVGIGDGCSTALNDVQRCAAALRDWGDAAAAVARALQPSRPFIE